MIILCTFVAAQQGFVPFIALVLQSNNDPTVFYTALE